MQNRWTWLMAALLVAGCEQDGNVGTNADLGPADSAPAIERPTDLGQDGAAADASQPGNGWAIAVGGDGEDVVWDVKVDSSGDLVVLAAYAGTVKLDGVSGDITLTGASQASWSNTFIGKLDPATRKFRWAVALDGIASMSSARPHSEAPCLALDAAGNIYHAGRFEGSATLGATTLTSAGDHDLFVAKLDPTGKVLWAISAGGPGLDDASALAVGTKVTLGGMFADTAAFGGLGLTAQGENDLFVAQLDPADGSFVWAARGGGDATGLTEYASGIALDSSGNGYLTGAAGGAATFGSNTLSGTAGQPSGFVAKINASGTFVWAEALLARYTSNITLDAAGNVYISGGTGFRSRAPDILTDSIIIVAKGDGAGIKWAAESGWPAYAIANDGMHASQVSVDGKGHAVVSGAFGGKVQLGTTILSSGAAAPMAFLARLDPTGAFTGGEVIPALQSTAIGLARDASGGLFVVGRFAGKADFRGISLTSHASGNDGYIWYTGGLE